jgi:RNA polymerase sigma-70 factor (ECF subfamily)
MSGTPHVPQSPSETRDLLQRWRQGDRGALDTLLERDLPWIQAHVRRQLGPALRSRLESGDIVQEAVIEFLKYGPAFVLSDGDQFHRLAAHVVKKVLGHRYDWFTAQRREVHRDRPLPSEDVLDLDGRRGREPTPSQEARRREREVWVRLALELLEPEDREVIVLREWEGLSLAALGEQLGISEDAARMRFNRAVQRLARKLRLLRSGRLEESLVE